MSYFTFKELLKSDTAQRLGINNMPASAVIIDNLDKLREFILDPLRKAMGFPIIVNSGFRSNEVNKAVGGVKNSKHLQGKAADIRASTVNGQQSTKEANKKIFDWLAAQKSSGAMPIKELIWEGNGTWIHVAM